MTEYQAAGLSRLYHAIREQAEQDLIAAIERDYPGMSEENKLSMLNRYRLLQARAEIRVIAEHECEQSRGTK